MEALLDIGTVGVMGVMGVEGVMGVIGVAGVMGVMGVKGVGGAREFGCGAGARGGAGIGVTSDVCCSRSSLIS